MGPSRRTRDQILLAVGVFLLAQGCSGGGGCGCTQPLPNGFPANERHPNSIQARVSDTGIAFLEANASGLVGALVPGGLTIDVPSSCGGNPEVCCGEPPGTCLVEIDMDPQPGDPPRMELTPRDPPGNQLGLVLRVRVRTVNPMPILYDTGLFSQVQISPIIDSTRSRMDFDLRLSERKSRWVDAGIGSGTTERFHATGEWGHRNLFGRGFQGALSSRVAFNGTGRFLLSHTELSLLEPWFLRTRTRAILTPTTSAAPTASTQSGWSSRSRAGSGWSWCAS